MKNLLSKTATACVMCALFCLLICCTSQREGRGGHKADKDPLQYVQWGMDTAQNRWQSLNILLRNNISRSDASSAIASIEANIQSHVTAMNPDWTARFWLFACKCDSSLFNLATNVVDGQDHSVSPPGGIPPTGGGGDVLYVSTNYPLQLDSLYSDIKFDSTRLEINATSTSEDILAFIDTGIDTTHFSKDLRKVIWTAPPGKQVLYNFLGGGYADNNFFDDHAHKHGSGVAAVAMMPLRNGPFPRIMILKALDSLKKGTTFTYNCALSYAIQNHARVVNVSLGYETPGTGDSISYEYLRRCRDTIPGKPIYVFTAAGNLSTIGTNVCDAGLPGNELRPHVKMFYPGCFSPDMSNMVNVTGLTADNKSCRYQNYSEQFVTLGVLNKSGCCKYVTPFFSFGFDGTSFATPAAAGMIMHCHLTNGSDIPVCIQQLQQTAQGTPFVTRQGHYLLYEANPPGLQ